MSETDTERTVVKTYVPAYQREVWDDHAEELDMSRSEFVKTMVQAGRRGFSAETRQAADRERNHSEDTTSTAGADESLETEVVEMLSAEPRDWDELLATLTAEVEESLDETLQALQDAGRVRYSGRDGGYILE
jgi:DNA-binding MurR/RpiR family transcriptional regulator